MQERTGFCILGLSCLARVSISICHIKTVTSISKHSSIAQRIQLQIMIARYTDIDVDIDHSVYPIVECLRKCSVIEPWQAKTDARWIDIAVGIATGMSSYIEATPWTTICHGSPPLLSLSPAELIWARERDETSLSCDRCSFRASLLISSWHSQLAAVGQLPHFHVYCQLKRVCWKRHKAEDDVKLNKARRSRRGEKNSRAACASSVKNIWGQAKIIGIKQTHTHTDTERDL